MKSQTWKRFILLFLAAALILSAGCTETGSSSQAGGSAESAEDLPVTGSEAETLEDLQVPETEPETEPQTAPETEPAGEVPTAGSQSAPAPEAHWNEVLEQYRQALADPEFTAEAYPLVNADAVSVTSMRWSRYADDSSALYAACHDIDGDGDRELIISRSYHPSGLHGDLNCICAIYVWNGSEPVELLRGVDFANDDFVSVFDNGVVRCVKNGYLTTPAEITEYRLDSETCALVPLAQWTYTCTEDGVRSFSGDGGTQTEYEFFSRYGDMVVLNSREDEPFAANPGTAERGPVADLEGVPGEDEGRSRLPKITLEGEGYESFNAAVQAEILQPYASGEDNDNTLGYSWSVNGDVLCLWVTSTYPGGNVYLEKVCRFSLSEGRELSEDELLALCGRTRDEVDAMLMPAVYGAFARNWETSGYGLEFISQDLSAPMQGMETKSRDSAALVLDRSGSLVWIVMVGSMGGASVYNQMVPVLR